MLSVFKINSNWFDILSSNANTFIHYVYKYFVGCLFVCVCVCVCVSVFPLAFQIIST